MDRRHRTIVIVSVVAATLFVAVSLLAAMRMQVMQNDPEPSSVVEVVEPRVVIRKKARTLELYDGERPIKNYGIALGFAPVGDKEKEGDGKTPEGDFYVFTKNPKSQFHLSIGLSYPSIDDARRGLSQGIITREEHDAIVTAIEKKEMPPQKTALGGEIYIHGGGTPSDWTWGCVALKNEDIEELYRVVKPRTPVSILP
jgi:murein L,D-transpeptidase YafK